MTQFRNWVIEIGSRDPGHAHFWAHFEVRTHRCPSSICVPNVKLTVLGSNALQVTRYCNEITILSNL